MIVLVFEQKLQITFKGKLLIGDVLLKIQKRANKVRCWMFEIFLLILRSLKIYIWTRQSCLQSQVQMLFDWMWSNFSWHRYLPELTKDNATEFRQFSKVSFASWILMESTVLMLTTALRRFFTCWLGSKLISIIMPRYFHLYFFQQQFFVNHKTSKSLVLNLRLWPISFLWKKWVTVFNVWTKIFKTLQYILFF